MAKAANGTTVRFPTTATSDVVGSLVSASYSSSGAKIDVSTLSSTKHIYEAGMPDNELTIEVTGEQATNCDVGDTGVLSIHWNSGGTNSFGNAVVVSNETSGEIDGAITTSITFAPAP